MRHFARLPLLFAALLALHLVAPESALSQEPALTVTEGFRKPEPLEITKVVAEVRVHGFVAETRMTMTFANRHNRALAGDLVFPLPDGATVSGYALDVGSVMVDGVAVEKEKARVAFESEVRRGIDPGLVEWVGGNCFRTRVFPILANGSRTVMVRYLGRLVDTPDGPAYELPLHFSKPIKEFSLRMEVVRGERQPVVLSGGANGFAFKRWRDSYVAEAHLRDVTPRETLVVSIPGTDRGVPTVAVERTPDGGTAFLVSELHREKLPGNPPDPSNVLLLWDASGTRGEVPHDRELDTLRRIFSGYSRTPVDVSVVLFRDRVEAPVRFRVKGGDATELLRFLESVDYDGGTSWSAAAEAAGNDRKAELALLFSDGLSTLGNAGPIRFRCRAFAFSADPRANHRLLRASVSATSGRYLNLAVTEPEAAATAAVSTDSIAFLGAEVLEGTVDGVSGGFAGDGPRFILSGLLRSPSARIRVRFGFPNGRGPGRSHVVTVDAAAAAEGTLLATFHAQSRVEDLLGDPKTNEGSIVRLAKAHGLATPLTSLIVLERLDQYVRHGIEPPASLPGMRAQYASETARWKVDRAARKEMRITRILALWNARVAWWNRSFDYPAGFDYVDAGIKGRGAGMSASERAQTETMVMDERAAAPPPSSAMQSRAAGPGKARRPAGFAMPDADAAPTMAASANPAAVSKGLAGNDAVGWKEESTGATIAVARWNPRTPYLGPIRAAAPSERYRAYLSARARYGRAPSFFLDCGNLFLELGERTLALRIWSNLSELELEDPSLFRVLAHRVGQAGEHDLSVALFEEVLRLRPEEAVSHRDLALALVRRGDAAISRNAGGTARADYNRAGTLLHDVVTGAWDRGDEIELIALTELNALIPKLERAGGTTPPLDPRLARPLDFDVRIVLTWDADLTDLDLHVVEPSGERAYYGHRDTTIGGRVSQDVTRGYGPEEYLVRRGMDGQYAVKTNYFGSSAQTLAGPVTLQVDIFTNYGRPDEKRQTITRRLDKVRGTVRIGEVEIGANG